MKIETRSVEKIFEQHTATLYTATLGKHQVIRMKQVVRYQSPWLLMHTGSERSHVERGADRNHSFIKHAKL